MMAPRPHVVAAFAFVVLSACGSPGSGPGARPQPAPAGRALGAPLGTLLDAAGGTLASASGAVVLTVPPGALTGPVEVSLTEVENTAPGGVGSAWRLAPEGLRLEVPATLTFVPGVPVAGLVVSWQAGGGGFWQRQRAVARDAAAGTVSAETTHFSDWAVTSGTTVRDLQGVVSLESTLGPPVTVTGELTLDYAGEDPSRAYYVLGGTLHAPSSYADGADTCTVVSPDFAARANVAELESGSGRFLWGTSGGWAVTCAGPGGSRSDTLLLAFDDLGVALASCPRTDLQPPLATPARVEGRQRADCGAQGTVTGAWTFVTCAAGAACTAPLPCRLGQLSCATALPTCADAGQQPDGTACGAVAGWTCAAGACLPP